jgi:pyridoxal phosphate enzyme (YggS family)
VGHLQTNKVKYVASFIGLIHSVDSRKLLEEINKQGNRINRKIPVLLQMYIAKEETKFGLDESELHEICALLNQYPNIEFRGLMGMATNTSDMSVVRNEFKVLKNIFNQVKKEYFLKDDSFKEISMGMSSDYLIAIEEGSTMVRVGSNIFGQRNIL